MKITIDFIFDIASPNAYLTHKVLPNFEKKNDVNIKYIPCLLGGIFKLTNNMPPMMAFANVKNKNDYQLIEIQRFIKKHKLNSFKFNENFPQNTLQAQRCLIAAQDLNCFYEVLDCLLEAMWEKNKAIGEQEVLIDCLKKSNIDAKKLMEISQSEDCKKQLIKNTDDAVARGAFGITTFFLDDQIFFGKDHMDQLEDCINELKN